ncbi:MAG TPA: hypothetical protein VHJ20_23035 [Polyangia bacterium]|nr:hypothetical protein [Polyangia bacterium]
MLARLQFGVVALVATAAGCVSPPATSDGGDEFVAFARDFQGFESWQQQTMTSETATGSTHVSGTRVVYINHLAPAGATEFPVGTLVVKRTEADGKLFARAKRALHGGGFNTTGADGWEWFELAETDTHDVSIQWRGLGPPVGEVYGGNAVGGCNLCHKAAPANDYMLTPAFAIADAGVVELPDTDGGANSDAAPDAGAPDSSPPDSTNDTASPDTASSDQVTHNE